MALKRAAREFGHVWTVARDIPYARYSRVGHGPSTHHRNRRPAGGCLENADRRQALAPEWTASVNKVGERVEKSIFGLGGQAQIEQPKLAKAVWTVTRFVPAKSFDYRDRAPQVRTPSPATSSNERVRWIESDANGSGFGLGREAAAGIPQPFNRAATWRWKPKARKSDWRATMIRC